MAIAQERLRLAEDLLSNVEARARSTTLNAPFAGTVIALGKQPGDRVEPYEAIGVIADLDELRVRAALPAEAQGHINVGDAASIRVNGTVETPLNGEVISLNEGAPRPELILAVSAGAAVPAPTHGAIPVTLTFSGDVRDSVPWTPSTALIKRNSSILSRRPERRQGRSHRS